MAPPSTSPRRRAGCWSSGGPICGTSCGRDRCSAWSRRRKRARDERRSSVAVDHDQRFKVLLQEFFREFFELFFPEWAEYFDFTAVEWFDKEVFTDPPAGSRRFLDMV